MSRKAKALPPATPPATPPDGIDVQEIDATLRSAGWKTIETRCREAAATKERELRGDIGEYQTAKARGFIEGVERCLAIPSILIGEGKAKSARP